MTDPRAVAIEVLTDALTLMAGREPQDKTDPGDYHHGLPTPTEFAATLMLASPRLASLLMTGTAVEMLPRSGAKLIHSLNGKWWVSMPSRMTDNFDTPLEAVNAALGDQT